MLQTAGCNGCVVQLEILGCDSIFALLKCEWTQMEMLGAGVMIGSVFAVVRDFFISKSSRRRLSSALDGLRLPRLRLLAGQLPIPVHV